MNRPWGLLLVALLCACETVNLDEQPADAGGAVTGSPVSTGQGTEQSPYTVPQLLDGNLPAGEVWVIGYAVGSTYKSMGNALFSVPTTYSANLLLAADSLCSSSAECLPVELSTTGIQNTLSLKMHPECFRHPVMVRGTVGKYFSQTGLRSVRQGCWVSLQDISSIDSSPHRWDEVDVDY